MGGTELETIARAKFEKMKGSSYLGNQREGYMFVFDERNSTGKQVPYADYHPFDFSDESLASLGASKRPIHRTNNRQIEIPHLVLVSADGTKIHEATDEPFTIQGNYFGLKEQMAKQTGRNISTVEEMAIELGLPAARRGVSYKGEPFLRYFAGAAWTYRNHAVSKSSRNSYAIVKPVGNENLALFKNGELLEGKLDPVRQRGKVGMRQVATALTEIIGSVWG